MCLSSDGKHFSPLYDCEHAPGKLRHTWQRSGKLFQPLKHSFLQHVSTVHAIRVHYHYVVIHLGRDLVVTDKTLIVETQQPDCGTLKPGCDTKNLD